ncbi:Uncharacterized membrane protein YeiH [Austwickia chelonae]|uniref:Glycine transporter domain-containing protein n=1 Tax=Austwickia chelonae NBRC 105200 TaxID=1184607 RepID=K6WC61_9MICO|nr:TRIC cation channel family protein [Austwickia chelonae]GAB79437.1 hypothetical protein AUCHE_25_00180 [Austwickia chelonae NBRC 105200]SEW36822.1 Uncharacterized membrane protein YeiH [Austwickia chelonae]
MRQFDPNTLFSTVDIVGVIANALLGGAVARARHFDVVGFIVLGVCSGLGGGIIRDLLLGVGLPVALTHSAYLPAAITSSVVAYLLHWGRWTNRLLVVADFLAVGCWAATGTHKALSVGVDWLPSVVVGVLTAVGGGMVRDVLVARAPVVFGGNPLYASVALVGSVEMLVLDRWHRPVLGMALSIGTCAALGSLARWRRWVLPGAAQWNLRLPVFSDSGRYVAVLRRPSSGGSEVPPEGVSSASGPAGDQEGTVTEPEAGRTDGSGGSPAGRDAPGSPPR